MSTKHIVIFTLLLGLILSSFTLKTKDESGYSIAKKMFERTSTINSLSYIITKEERIKGKMVQQISFTKMEKKPFKVYLRQSSPKNGMEVLYVNGTNNNKAIINPNGFPWVNLKLNPLDGFMRSNQHHTIFQSGFEYVVSILEFLCNKYNSEIEDLVTYNGVIKHQNRDCHSILFRNPYFKYIDYKMSENETIEDVATKFKISAYMIMELNRSIKDFDDVAPGDVIKIPNDYSSGMLLFVDKEELIPIRMDIYDKKGLYERYEYSEVVINPIIPSEEFSPDYHKYGF